MKQRMKGIFHRFKQKDTPNEKKPPAQDDKYIPDELTLKKIGKKKDSPLNDPVWKASLLVLSGSFLLGLLQLIIGYSRPILSWFPALAALATWILTVRMLLMDAKLKIFWIGWLVLSIVLPLLLSRGGNIWGAAVGGSFFFLLFRKYRPYRHLTSRRRAALFCSSYLWVLSFSTGHSVPHGEQG